MDERERLQALQDQLLSARRHLESGDRDQALELIDAALAIDAKLLAGSAPPDSSSLGRRPPDPAIVPPVSKPVSDSWHGLERLEQIARQRRIEVCLAAASASIGRRQLAEARAAIEEIKELDPDHPELTRLELEMAAASPLIGTGKLAEARVSNEEIIHEFDPPHPEITRFEMEMPAAAASIESLTLAEARAAVDQIKQSDSAPPEIEIIRLEMETDRARSTKAASRVWAWLATSAVLLLFVFVVFALSQLDRSVAAPYSSATADLALEAMPAAEPSLQVLSPSEPPVITTPEPSVSSDPAPSTGPVGSSEPGGSSESVRPSEPVRPSAPVRSAASVGSSAAVEPPAPVGSSPPVRPSGSIGSSSTVKPSAPVGPAAGVEPPAPAGSSAPVRPSPQSASARDTATIAAPPQRFESPSAVTATPAVEPSPAAPVPAPQPSVVQAATSTPAAASVFAPPAVESGVAPARSAGDDDRQIRQVLERYRAAYEKLDARSARQVWPGVDQNALTRAFEALESQRVTFAECDIAVRGVLATAECSGTARYVTKVGNREPRIEPRSWTFTLRRTGPEWKIDQARAAR